MRLFECKWMMGVMLIIVSYSETSGQKIKNTNWKMKSLPIQTKWAKEVTPQNVLPNYPRPQMVRADKWQNLNGLWSYAIRENDELVVNSFDGKILVPFPLESALSGVGKSLLPEQ